MKKVQWLAAPMLAASLLLFTSCGTSPTTINGNWIGIGSPYAFEGATRSGAFEFTIGNSAYVGLGFGGKNNNQYLQDVYVFNLDSNFWKEVAPFPGLGRELSISFSLGNKGYVGTGYNRNIANIDSVELGDFWTFDPTGDTVVNGKTLAGSWKRLHDFPGNPRWNALAFTIGTGGGPDDQAFVGTGYDGSYYDDCYIYTPGTDTWRETTPFPGAKREGAMTLKIDGIIYFFGGDSNGIYNSDLWQYYPDAAVWKPLTEVTTNGNYNDFRAGVRRSNACAMTLGDYGYVICGTTGTPSTLVYQFAPQINQGTWTRMTAFETAARYQAVCFVLGSGTNEQRGFVTTGLSGTRRFDDMVEWQPTVAYNQAD